MFQGIPVFFDWNRPVLIDLGICYQRDCFCSCVKNVCSSSSSIKTVQLSPGHKRCPCSSKRIQEYFSDYYR
jgi:hypothetical protein